MSSNKNILITHILYDTRIIKKFFEKKRKNTIYNDIIV